MNQVFRLHNPLSFALLAWGILASSILPSLAAPPTSAPTQIPTPIRVTVGNVTLREGTGGSVTAFFPITLSAPASETLQIAYETRAGSARANLDYLERKGIHTIPVGTVASTLPIPIVPDDLGESVESFGIALLPSPGVDFTTPVALATILDDDLPKISLRNVTALEGTGFQTTIRVPVTLSNPSSLPVTVQVAVFPGSAESPSDFSPTRGTVTFPAGSQWEYFEFPIQADLVAEFEETIRVELSEPVNASLDVAGSEVLILDDDTIPIISVAEVSTKEGTGAESSLDFRITLSGPALEPVRVSYLTRGDTADPASDYIQRLGTLVIPSGVTEAILTVRVIGDALPEPDEQFLLILRSPVNATLGTSTAPGVIRDDDRPLTVSVANTSSPEGSPGNPRQLTFDVVLSEPPLDPVTVNYATRGLTAVPGADYVNTSGFLTFVTIGPGSTRHQVHVPIVADNELEPNETLELVLSEPRNAALGKAIATGTLLNDDGPTLVIDDLTVTEGDVAEIAAVFSIRRMGPTDTAVIASFNTVPRTASAQTDFIPAFGVVSIPPGASHTNLTILIRPDRASEPAEAFEVTLSDAVGASLLRPTAVGTILDNDLPSLTTEPTTIFEGGFGSSKARFVIRLDSPPIESVFVQYHVEPGTAVGGEDYLPISGTLVFPPGVLERQVDVPVLGDTLDEDNETFLLVLSHPQSARVPTPETLATIVDDDPLPLVSIEDTEARECSPGGPDTSAEFRVRLNTASGRSVTVPYRTRSVNAVSELDFTGVTNSVLFPAGSTLGFIRIPIACDEVEEPDEIFEIILGPPDTAILSRARARALILDDDVPPPPNLPPSVTLSVPPETDQATAGVPVALSAQASDPEGALASVSFYANAVLLGQVTTPPYSLVWSNAPSGDHTLLALALDQGGLSASSVPLTIRLLPPAQLRASPVNASEGDRTAQLPLTLSRSARETVQARLTTRDLSAVAGSDYVPLATQITFPPGVTNLVVALPLIDDAAHEPEESFLVDLEFPEILDLGAPQPAHTGTITIRDDDPAPPTHSPPRVTRSGPPETDQAPAGVP
ncbi:MAG: Calx-beta domain-containing protein, partial [Limisphaerales bacterium]